MSVYDGFAALYDAWAADMTDDVDFYVELARDADSSIVEHALGPVASRSRRRSEPASE